MPAPTSPGTHIIDLDLVVSPLSLAGQSVQLLGIGPAPIAPAANSSISLAGQAVAAAGIVEITPAANSSISLSPPAALSVVEVSPLLPMIRGETRQVLAGAAVGEVSRVTYENSGRVGGKRHGMEVQISRASGAGDITVEVQGRADQNAPWAILYQLTCLAADETAVVEEIPYMTQLRLEVTAAAAATVNGWFLA